MELGKRLKEARLALGLSQRQLCGDAITRNMLSQIENGAARPSMDTLRYLAARLGKNVSYFLEEQTVTSPNQQVMAAAREAYRAERWEDVLTALAGYQEPDPLFDQEAALLRYLALVESAAEALARRHRPHAAALLEEAAEPGCMYVTAALERRRLLLLARATGRGDVLPTIDEDLLVRAECALAAEDISRAAALLDSVRDRGGAEWNLLRGRVYLKAAAYAEAAVCLHRAEEAYPAETAPLLEEAYRELKNFERAYFYACKQR